MWAVAAFAVAIGLLALTWSLYDFRRAYGLILRDLDDRLGRVEGEIGRLESRIDELAEDVVAAPREEENDAAI